MFMLSVNVQKQRRDPAHLRRRTSLAVDLADAAAAGNLPNDQNLSVERFYFHLLQRLLHFRIFRLKNQLHQGGIRALPDHFSGQFFPQRQIDGTDQNRFSGAGLTGQNI